MQNKDKIKIVNNSKAKMKVILEPWAEDWFLEPKQEIEFVTKQLPPPNECFSIICYDAAIVAFAPAGVNILVFVDGCERESWGN